MARPRKETQQPVELDFRLAFERAVNVMGSNRALAEATGNVLSHTTIRNFLGKTSRPPRPEHAIAVENATEGRVDRMEFYPMVMAGPLGRRIGRALRRANRAGDPDVSNLLSELQARGIRL